jgi:hypothetical protein
LRPPRWLLDSRRPAPEAEAARANYNNNVLCSNSLSSAVEDEAGEGFSKWKSCKCMGWVASHEHILLPFSTPQTHTLPSADTKATEEANNKNRLGVRHDIVWCHTTFCRTVACYADRDPTNSAVPYVLTHSTNGQMPNENESRIETWVTCSEVGTNPFSMQLRKAIGFVKRLMNDICA